MKEFRSLTVLSKTLGLSNKFPTSYFFRVQIFIWTFATRCIFYVLFLENTIENKNYHF